MSDRSALKCEKCGAGDQQTRYADLKIGNADRVFALSNRESVQHWVPQSEVDHYRKAYGQAGNCIQNDGTVLFNCRSEERKYRQAKQQHEAASILPEGTTPGTIHADGDGPRRSSRRAATMSDIKRH